MTLPDGTGWEIGRWWGRGPGGPGGRSGGGLGRQRGVGVDEAM